MEQVPFFIVFCLSVWHDCWSSLERPYTSYASPVHQSHSYRYARQQEYLPVSHLQDPPEGTHIRMDIQSKDQREGIQVDFSWSGYAAAELTENSCLFGTSKGFHFNNLYQVEKSKEINTVTDFFHNLLFFFFLWHDKFNVNSFFIKNVLIDYNLILDTYIFTKKKVTCDIWYDI